MRKIAVLLLLSLALAYARAQEVAPVAGERNFEQIDSLLDRYVIAIQRSTADAKMHETDFMIGAATDSSVRQHIALKLFDYYKEAPVMGDEAVAIHIYDRWFKDGGLKWRSEFDEMDAKLFADFNRSSLVGMQAPKITLRKPCKGRIQIPEEGSTAVIWFFDTSCGKCAMEAKVLPGILEKADFPLNFYAVYAGQSKKDWKAFRKEFKVAARNVRIVHLWDPEIESDYLRLYGVISTPRLFMTEPSGTIIGRRLEPESLQQMLPVAKEILKIYGQQ